MSKSEPVPCALRLPHTLPFLPPFPVSTTYENYENTCLLSSNTTTPMQPKQSKIIFGANVANYYTVSAYEKLAANECFSE